MECHDLRAALRIRTKYYKLLGRQALNISIHLRWRLSGRTNRDWRSIALDYVSVTTNPAVATIRKQMPSNRNNLFSIDRTRTLAGIAIYEGLNDLCTVSLEKFSLCFCLGLMQKEHFAIVDQDDGEKTKTCQQWNDLIFGQR